MNRLITPLIPLVLLSFSACGGSGAAPAESPASAPPQTFAEQVALGQTLFGEKCAGCHGDSGEGNKGPRVVGLAEGALPLDPPPSATVRKSQFATVMDVASFVVQAMPPSAPGSLSQEEYFSILAFDLKANGIELDQKLDGALAQTLVIPRADDAAAETAPAEEAPAPAAPEPAPE